MGNTVEVLVYSLGVIIVLGIAFWVLFKYFISQTFQKIDDSSAKLAILERTQALQAMSIENIESDVSELKNAWKTSNEGISKLTNTIQVFDSNSKIYHNEIKTLVSDNTRVMNEVLIALNNLKK